MVPVEWMVLTLWLCFAIVGLARQFPKELGATIVFTGMLLAFDIAGAKMGSVTYQVLHRFDLADDQALVTWFVYSLVIFTVVSLAYVGETLSYSGVWSPGPVLARVFDVFIGLFNGWIIVGTWWYYSSSLSYPMQKLGWFVPPTSSLANTLLQWTPSALIPDQGSYIYIAAFLLLLLGLKVVR